jgi:hypothetical protein
MARKSANKACPSRRDIRVGAVLEEVHRLFEPAFDFADSAIKSLSTGKNVKEFLG